MLQRAKKRDLNRRRSLEAHDTMMRKDEALTSNIPPTQPAPLMGGLTQAQIDAGETFTPKHPVHGSRDPDATVGDVKPTEPPPSSDSQTPAAETKENDATSQ